MENLKYTLDAEKFPPGWFELNITDVTRGIREDQRLKPYKILIKIFDSVAEAEEAARLAAEAKAAGKKK